KSASTNSSAFPRRFFRFKIKLPIARNARRANKRTNAPAASTDELKEWEPASRPAGLDGGEQAQRNRAMCNRQHKFPPAQRRVFGLQALECLGPQHIIAISLVWRKTV